MPLTPLKRQKGRGKKERNTPNRLSQDAISLHNPQKEMDEINELAESECSFTGDFALDFSNLCNTHGLIHIPVIVKRTMTSTYSDVPRNELKSALGLLSKHHMETEKVHTPGSSSSNTKKNLRGKVKTHHRASPAVQRVQSKGRVHAARQASYMPEEINFPHHDHGSNHTSTTDVNAQESQNHNKETSLVTVNTWECMRPQVEAVVFVTHDRRMSAGQRNKNMLANNETTIPSNAIEAIYIRNWLLDELFAKVLFTCFSNMKYLNSVYICRAGVNLSTLTIICSMMPPQLSTFSLESNPVIPPTNYAMLVPDNSIEKLCLQNLTVLFLRYNSIGDEGVTSLSAVLKRRNCTLQQICLSGNAITCQGAISLADALRTNIHLKWMDLGGNRVASLGASVLAQVLACYTLKKEEIRQRRNEKIEDLLLLSAKKQKSTHSSPRPSITTSTRKGSADLTSSKRRGDKKKNNPGTPDAALRDEMTSGGTRGRSSRERGNRHIVNRRIKLELGRDGEDPPKRRSMERKASYPNKHILESTNSGNIVDCIPIISGDDMWVAGNQVLQHLNLSDNPVGFCGIKALESLTAYKNTSSKDKTQIKDGWKLDRNNSNIILHFHREESHQHHDI